MSPLLPFLAELPDPQSATSIGWLVVTVSALAVAYNSILSIVDRHKKKEPSGTEIIGQPLEVRASPEYARREELAALVVRQDRLEERFEAVAKELAAAGEDRVRRLHSRIDTVLVAVGQTNTAIGRMEGELKRLPCDRCAT